MIDTKKLKPGDKVRVRMDARSHTICDFLGCMNKYLGQVMTVDSVSSLGNVVLYPGGYYFHPSWLDPIDPPAPKRVEVVTETRTVQVTEVKSVTIHLPAEQWHDLMLHDESDVQWKQLNQLIKAALAEQEAKS